MIERQLHEGIPGRSGKARSRGWAHATGSVGTLIHVVKTLDNWFVAANKGTLSKIGRTEQKTPTDLEAELARVKRVAVKSDRIDVMRQDCPIAVLCRVFEMGATAQLLRLTQTP